MTQPKQPNPFEWVARQIADLRKRISLLPSFAWGVVESIDPLTVRIAGEDSAPGTAPVAIGPVFVGAKVLTLHLGTAWIVLGVRNPPAAPWATAQDAVTITGTGTIDASTTVAFPAGLFAVPPLVSFSTGNINFNVSWTNLTTAGMTVNIRRMDYATFTGSIPVHWRAVQMTPTGAGG